MNKHIIEISDKNETSLQIVVNRPVVGQDKWSSLNKGVWAYNSGAINIIDKTDYNIFKGDPGDGITLHKHLILCNTPHISRTGVVLWDYLGWTGVNDGGTGVMWDGWSYSVGGSPNGGSAIRWTLID